METHKMYWEMSPYHTDSVHKEDMRLLGHSYVHLVQHSLTEAIFKQVTLSKSPSFAQAELR